MKRCSLLLSALFLSTGVWSQSIPLGEIIGDDRSIRDPLYGLTARYPTGWFVRGVTRWGDRETTIYFGASSPGDATPTLYYRVYSQPISLPADAEAYLRDQAQKKEEQRISGGLADYANVVDSFELKTVGGHPASSYTARFTGGGTTQVEYFVRVLSSNGVALFFLRAPLAEFDGLRPGFDAMVDTIRLP
ncbi:MAG: hypothetical protein ACREH8_10280 [Opitutaceae bacterium]